MLKVAYNPELADVCTKSPEHGKDRRDQGGTRTDTHFPMAVGIVEADANGTVLLSVRCIHCGRHGELTLELREDANAACWEMPR